VKEMVAKLVEGGEGAAEAWCAQDDQAEFDRLLEFKTSRNEILADQWSVSGTWSFRCAPKRAAQSLAAQLEVGELANEDHVQR
jgi:hypothetical protein